ncbi:MAG: hypothetical protein NTAFB05_20870 [Nitrobacter sp.]
MARLSFNALTNSSPRRYIAEYIRSSEGSTSLIIASYFESCGFPWQARSGFRGLGKRLISRSTRRIGSCDVSRPRELDALHRKRESTAQADIKHDALKRVPEPSLSLTIIRLGREVRTHGIAQGRVLLHEIAEALLVRVHDDGTCGRTTSHTFSPVPDARRNT